MRAPRFTPRPWLLATSCSWRRFVGGPDQHSICEPITQRDGHPDLYFRNGGQDGPDAKLMEAAPDLFEALEAMVGLFGRRGCNAADIDAIAAARAALAKARGEALR